MKKTLILGATPNTSRYAYIAAERLTNKNHDIVPVGIKTGEVFGKEIITDHDKTFDDIDTITLYIGPRHQPQWYDYILQTKPNRIIFNPGTENSELMQMAREEGIDVEIACTLVLLGSGQY